MRLHDVFDYQARERPSAEFAVHGNCRLTYREALIEVHQLAHALVSAGLQIGDRVAILAKNRLESLLLYFAASKTGVVPVPLNYRLAPPEWAYILQDAQVKLLIAAEEYLPAIEGIRSKLTGVAHGIALTEHPPRGWRAYRQWIASQATTAPACPITDDLDVYQMYTSGTTGHPKGVVLTYRAVTSHLAQLTLAFGHRAGKRCLLVVPLYHAAGALHGGWMHTGDAGRLDAEGYLYIHDRITDMIVSGGENVYPQKVEQVLLQHPAIADAAVIGVPDAQWGETVKAIVVVRPGMTATAEELMAFCRGQLGGFERPRSVDMVGDVRQPEHVEEERVMNSWNDYALQWEADKSWVVVEDRRVLAANKLGYLERLGHEWGTQESVDQVVSEFILPYTGTKKVIVEIGSGGGRIAYLVAPHVSHLICLDVERDMLRLCSAALSNAPNVTCLLISKSSVIPLISDSVDLVYSFDTMVHLDERTIFRYMQETRRVIRRGGILMLHVATHETTKGWEHFEDGVTQGVSRGQFGSFEYLDSHAVIRMAERAGFSEVKRSVEGEGNFYYERDRLFVLRRR